MLQKSARFKFHQLNLLADFASLGTFDMVFCRNVLIYFAQETKTDVLNRLAKAIASDGYLCSARQKRQSA